MAERSEKINLALDDIISSNRKGRAKDGHSPRDRSHGKQNRRRAGPMRTRQPRNITVEVLNDRPARHQSASRGGGGAVFSTTATTTLVVSNLFHEVNEGDLRDLFNQVGPVSSVRILFDRAGRSTGVAHVTFGSRRDATVAIDRFHHVPLDGYPMQLDFMTAPMPVDEARRGDASRSLHSPPSTSSTPIPRPRHHDVRHGSRGGVRKQSFLHAGGRQSGSHRARRTRPEEKTPNSAQLDTDLDNYMMKTG